MPSNSERILFLEACNFVNAPFGGQLTAARMFISALGSRMALAGWTDDPHAPIGRWHKKVINGVKYDFFATDYVPGPRHGRPILPARAMNWFQFKKYGRAILSCGIRNVLTQEPTVMMALPLSKAHNVCFWFPGIEPALSLSRYRWARYFSSVFDIVLNRRLRQHAGKILAAADAEAIEGLRRRANGLLDPCDIRCFPTRVDTSLFRPGNKLSARRDLLIDPNQVLLVTSGRIHRAKGWPLLLDAFAAFRRVAPHSRLVFVGDGSDRTALEATTSRLGIDKHVSLVGYQPPEVLALYLQAADLFVMGSEKEGWSTSLVEALACGVPIVTTRFSSADSIVRNGCNGFVVDRDPLLFADAMVRALDLQGVGEHSARESRKYALTDLAAALEKAWPLA